MTWLTGNTNPGIHESEVTAENVLAKLTEVQALLRHADKWGDVDISFAESMARACTILYSIHRYLPKVECWAVVKHYAIYGLQSMETACLVGCLNEQQAKDVALALSRHYSQWRDTYEVEYRGVPVYMILTPDTTAEEYMREHN